MNTGEAFASSGVAAKLIRCSEETGLIPVLKRSDAGYRVQGDRDAQMLGFVGRAASGLSRRTDRRTAGAVA